MTTATPQLRPVDRLEVISLVDNMVDLQSAVPDGVLRFWEWASDPKHAAAPWAEHGFAALVRVYEGDTVHTILFDTGAGPSTAVINARRLLLNLGNVEAIVLSHGHPDHAGGLLGVLPAIGRADVPVIVHEHAFLTRGHREEDGTVRRDPPFPGAEVIRQAGGQPTITNAPLTLADGGILLTGEIPMRTDFEHGRPNQVLWVDNQWQPEPRVLDDQALIVHVRAPSVREEGHGHVRDVGLVVVTGCAHAGIVNTVWYVRELVPDVPVHAIIGGFHLVGPDAETLVARAVAELAAVGPARIVPSHCTGSLGVRALAAALPDAFVPAGVGNMYRFPEHLPESSELSGR